MTTTQPRWKFVANLGDASPLDYGGLFVYVDETGVYPPELEVCERDSDKDDSTYTIYRVPLECCTITDGILSDNKFHPEHPAWFADELLAVAQCNGTDKTTLTNGLLSEDATERASAYVSLAGYFGWHEFDHYPLTMRRRELCARYLAKNGENYGKRD